LAAAAAAAVPRRKSSCCCRCPCEQGEWAPAGPGRQAGRQGPTAAYGACIVLFQASNPPPPPLHSLCSGITGSSCLPVPLPACSCPVHGCRQSGDVKLAVSIFVSGWITQKSDFESAWQGCTAADAGLCAGGACHTTSNTVCACASKHCVACIQVVARKLAWLTQTAAGWADRYSILPTASSPCLQIPSRSFGRARCSCS
jgi:hypothetical protein